MLIKLTDMAWSSIEIHAYYADDDGLDTPEFVERHRTLQARASAKGVDIRSLSPSQLFEVAKAMDEIADVEEDAECDGKPISTKALRSAAAKVRRAATIAQIRNDWPAGINVAIGGRVVPIVAYSDDEAATGKVRIRIGDGNGAGTLVSAGHLAHV